MTAKVEFVASYGVFLTQWQLDEAMDCSTPTKLIPNLGRVFFEPNILAKSSALGTSENTGLDREIFSACISKHKYYTLYL